MRDASEEGFQETPRPKKRKDNNERQPHRIKQSCTVTLSLEDQSKWFSMVNKYQNIDQ